MLMVEVGYKYKFFGDDAKVAAKELGMVAFNDRNFVVASIPTHRRDVHLKKLLAQGYRVGLVQQIETAALKKIGDNRNAPFDRKLTHLYTAATYVDVLDSVDDLEKYSPSQFMCLIEEKKPNIPSMVSIAMISICTSTGDVVWDEFDDTIMRIELETRLGHIRPSELLLPRKGLSEPTSKMLSQIAGTSAVGSPIRIEHFPEIMPYEAAFSKISGFYTDKTKTGVASESFTSGKLLAESIGLPKRVITALAHTIKYLSAFGLADALLETKFFNKFTTRAHMLLAANTLANLEIYCNDTDKSTHGSLLWILDRTKTKFGARLLRDWVGRPLIDKRVLQDRVDAVEELKGSTSEKWVTLRQVLRRLPDLARGLCRIQYGQCTPQELAVLLTAFSKIAQAFDETKTAEDVGFNSRLLNDIIFSLPKLRQPIKNLLDTVNISMAAEGKKEAMWVDPERHPNIANAEMAIIAIEVGLQDELKRIRKLLRFPSLTWSSHLDDEYLVEVKNKDNRPIPDEWTLHSKTKTHARYQPPEVRAMLEERAQYKEMLQVEANEAFQTFLKEISQNCYAPLRDAVNKLAIADCLLSFAQVALQENYVRPEYLDDNTLEIVDGRHPMVEALRADPYVPNSVTMTSERSLSKIITGPNMGGKSSSVRMIALIVIMAQIGCYVPALSVKLGLVDSILTRMGASDDIARGHSTFMVEMSETSEILHSATNKSLVILDELGRGTSTFDGMAIAHAVLEYLVKTTKCKTLFITHYPVVASSLEKKYPSHVQNLHMGYEADTRVDGTRDITFTYRLKTGMASESFGIECGRLAGLDRSILSIATERSSQMRQEVEGRIRKNKAQKSARLISHALTGTSLETVAIMEELRTLSESISSPS